MVRCHCCSQNVVLLVFNFFLNTYVLPHPPPLPFCASHSQHLFPIRFIVFRMWRSWEAGCSPVTWFTARGTGAATVTLFLFRTQKCYFGLIIISIICSFISASLHPPLLCLIIFSFSSPSSPQLGLHEFSLCALSLSLPDFLLSWKLTSLLRPLLWICALLLWGLDAEYSSRQADTLQRRQVFKDCVCFCFSERRNDHSAGK